jgi:hypothetical protein
MCQVDKISPFVLEGNIMGSVVIKSDTIEEKKVMYEYKKIVKEYLINKK